MSRLQAIIRQPARTLNECELTFLERRRIDIDRARRQHADYAEVLRSLGVDVTTLPARDEWPDSVFVEDAAIVLDEIAVITRPGVTSRQGEGAGIVDAVRPFRTIHVMREPSTLDGGDVVRLGRSLYVGLSARSNAEGIEELRAVTEPFGYTVTPVAIDGCLHLKSACVALSPVDLFADPTRVDTASFRANRILIVPPDEGGAADALAIGDTVLIDAGYPTTHALLVNAGYNVRELDLSEFAKAEAGPTCLSLIFETQQSTVDCRQSTVESQNAATSAPRPKRRSRT